ncbi:MAG: helix-turn-helix domain-containing protein [Planctomycetota bacterium]
MDKWLSVKEVSEVFGVCTRTIHRLILKHGLPASKIGGQWRISQDNLNSYTRTSQSFMWDMSVAMIWFSPRVLEQYRKDPKYYVQETTFYGRLGLKELKYKVQAYKSNKWTLPEEKRKIPTHRLFVDFKFWKIKLKGDSAEPIRKESFVLAVDAVAYGNIPEAEQKKWQVFRVLNPQV